MRVRGTGACRNEGMLIGTAGWSIPRVSADRCGGEGSHLARYARVFTAAEINSSFHRPHRRSVYERWAADTPAGFRFAVKLPRAITHDTRLRRARQPLAEFLEQSGGLGEKRGPLLMQLPPSFAFDARVAGRFLTLLRAAYAGPVVCEPRHATWFTTGAERLLLQHHVARVAADPPPVPGADEPGGWHAIVYYRLHGSPRKYWSRYSASFIDALQLKLSRHSSEQVWCVFDNTASGAALENAWELLNRVR